MNTSLVLNVFEGRQGNESTWDIPLKEPSHHWAVPLAVMEGEQPRRVGTVSAFRGDEVRAI